MMNSLLLINSGPSATQFALFLAISFLVTMMVLRSRLAGRANANTADTCINGLSMSAFSRQASSSRAYEEDVNPLTEAEIYVIYGRKKDAQRVLDQAVSEGRLSEAEVACFWSLHTPD